MKFIFASFCILFLSFCKTKKIGYNIPDNLPENVKTEVIANFNKGALLYELHCSNCHSKKEGKKKILPKFTQEQIESYTIRSNNKDHLERLSPQTLLESDIESIKLFLLYKK